MKLKICFSHQILDLLAWFSVISVFFTKTCRRGGAYSFVLQVESPIGFSRGEYYP